MKSIPLKTKILFLIVIILTGIAIMLSVPQSKKSDTASLIKQPERIAKLELAQVTDGSIVKKIMLIKTDDKFFILNPVTNERFPANQQAVKNLLQSLRMQNKIELVSRTANESLFRSGVLLKAYDSNENIISNINFGSIDILGLNRYVKFGTETVYLVNDIYSGVLKVSGAFFVDQQVCKEVLSNTNIQAVSCDGKKRYRTNNNQHEFTEIENALKFFSCLDILYDYADYPELQEENRIDHSFEVMLGNKKSFELQFTELSNGDYAVYSSITHTHFIASQFSVNRLLSVLVPNSG